MRINLLNGHIHSRKIHGLKFATTQVTIIQNEKRVYHLLFPYRFGFYFANIHDP